MLLCLDREQRLTFILGAIFEVSDTVGAEVLEITPDNFRQRLARARRDLRNFMNDKCIYWLPFASKACPFRKSTILPGQKQTVSPQRVFAFSGRVVIACQRLMDLNAKAGRTGVYSRTGKSSPLYSHSRKAVSHGYYPHFPNLNQEPP
jgi:hypothetical protein